MKIDQDTVKQIAHLARLELTDTERADTLKDMNRILTFMDKLNELDTDGVEPLVYMTDGENILREDVVIQEINHDEALLNAPQTDGRFFQVAKVIEKFTS